MAAMPIARREVAGGVGSLELNARAVMKSSSASSLAALRQASASGVDSQGKSCPGGVTCGEKADKMVWSQSCWDCLEDYKEFYCEKNSLTEPKPTFVDVCASKDSAYRGAYCKKFAEADPPQYIDPYCFFDGSEYKEVFCAKMTLASEWKTKCATDADVGGTYCEGFATNILNYTEAMQYSIYTHCHGWPGFMMLYCASKKKSANIDATCANHKEVGADYCETFALQKDISADCSKYPSYLSLYCDIKASKNVSHDTCASNEKVSGMYCQQLALKKNGFKTCWGVAQFDSTYCAEITWPVANCETMADGESLPSPNP